MKEYLVNYCLNNETDFEDSHSLYDQEKGELWLSIQELDSMLKQCASDSDNLGVSFQSDFPGKWDALEVHGMDGDSYTLEYQFGSKASSYFKTKVTRQAVVEAIKGLPVKPEDLDIEEMEVRGW